MKQKFIATQELVKLEACREGILAYVANGLDKIDWNKVKRITVYNFGDASALHYLCQQFNLSLEIVMEESNTSYQLDKFRDGLPIYHESYDCFARTKSWAKWLYNKNRLITHCNRSDGTWDHNTYKNELLIYFENSTGYWEKYAYDKNKNRIYQETSEGYWVKYTFVNNVIIKQEASDGTIRDFTTFKTKFKIDFKVPKKVMREAAFILDIKGKK
jgi:hypothetical protein